MDNPLPGAWFLLIPKKMLIAWTRAAGINPFSASVETTRQVAGLRVEPVELPLPLPPIAIRGTASHTRR
jgi:hypothetical protein